MHRDRYLIVTPVFVVRNVRVARYVRVEFSDPDTVAGVRDPERGSTTVETGANIKTERDDHYFRSELLLLL